VLILLAINAVSCRAGRVVFVLIYKDLGPWTPLGTVWFQHTRLYACTLVRSTSTLFHATKRQRSGCGAGAPRSQGQRSSRYVMWNA
jgi:hypothetical protein